MHMGKTALTFFLLFLFSASIVARTPHAAIEQSQYQSVSLFNGAVKMMVPTVLQKDREYLHYWDECQNGGYTATFASQCSDKKGVSAQVNVHNTAVIGKQQPNWYDPKEHCIKNTVLLADTTYAIGNRSFTLKATMVEKTNSGAKRNGGGTHNYNLSYYITEGSHMLEFHYFYWDKDGRNLSYWIEVSQAMLSSVRWQNNPVVAGR